MIATSTPHGSPIGIPEDRWPIMTARRCCRTRFRRAACTPTGTGERQGLAEDHRTHLPCGESPWPRQHADLAGPGITVNDIVVEIDPTAAMITEIAMMATSTVVVIDRILSLVAISRVSDRSSCSGPP